MGGFLGLLLAQKSSNISHVVAIDTTLNFEISKNEKDFIFGLNSKDAEDIFKSITKTAMINREFDDLDLMAQKSSERLKVWNKDRKRFNDLIREALFYDKRKLLQNCNAKVLYIGRKDTKINKKTLLAFSEDIKYISLDSGHFVMLNKPKEVNESINAFLEV